MEIDPIQLDPSAEGSPSDRPWDSSDECHLKMGDALLHFPVGRLQAIPIIKQRAPNFGGVGSSADNPLVLADCTSSIIDTLLKVIETPRLVSLNMSKEEWGRVLGISMKWDMHELRTLATQEISPLLSSIEKVVLGRLLRVESLFLEGCGRLSLPARPPYEGLGVEGLASAVGWELAAQIAYATLLTSDAVKTRPAVVALDALSCLTCRKPKLLFSIDTRRSASDSDPQGGHVEVAKPPKYRHPEGDIRVPDIFRYWYCHKCSSAIAEPDSKMSVNVGDGGTAGWYDFMRYKPVDFDNSEIVRKVFAQYIKDMF